MLTSKNCFDDLQQSTMRRQEKKNRISSKSFSWRGGQETKDETSNQLFLVIYSRLRLSNTSQISLCLHFFPLFLVSISSSLHLSAWLGRCSRGPGSIVQFHTCLLYWHLSAHIFAWTFPPHIILHFLYNDTPSLISLCELIPGPEDQNTITMLVFFFFF